MQTPQLDLHPFPQDAIERAEGFVQKQQGGLVDEGPGQGDALLLASRELGGTPSAKPFEAHQREGLVHLAAALRALDAACRQRIADIGGRAHVGKEGVALEHDAEVPPFRHHPGDLVCFREHRAAGRRLEARDHHEQGGLPRPARPEQGDELSLRDVEIDAAQSVLPPVVGLVEPSHRERGGPSTPMGGLARVGMCLRRMHALRIRFRPPAWPDPGCSARTASRRGFGGRVAGGVGGGVEGEGPAQRGVAGTARRGPVRPPPRLGCATRTRAGRRSAGSGSACRWRRGSRSPMPVRRAARRARPRRRDAGARSPPRCAPARRAARCSCA